jgi:hypothetical protein
MEEKPSSSKTQRCRLARDVRAAATHRDPDMSSLERRSVVDAVAGHGDDPAICLEGHHNAQLLFVSEARGRLRTGLAPDEGFGMGFVDGLTAAEPVPHAIIHIVRRRAGDRVTLLECRGWINDEGVVG